MFKVNFDYKNSIDRVFMSTSELMSKLFPAINEDMYFNINQNNVSGLKLNVIFNKLIVIDLDTSITHIYTRK